MSCNLTTFCRDVNWEDVGRSNPYLQLCDVIGEDGMATTGCFYTEDSCSKSEMVVVNTNHHSFHVTSASEIPGWYWGLLVGMSIGFFLVGLSCGCWFYIKHKSSLGGHTQLGEEMDE